MILRWSLQRAGYTALLAGLAILLGSGWSLVGLAQGDPLPTRLIHSLIGLALILAVGWGISQGDRPPTLGNPVGLVGAGAALGQVWVAQVLIGTLHAAPHPSPILLFGGALGGLPVVAAGLAGLAQLVWDYESHAYESHAYEYPTPLHPPTVRPTPTDRPV